MMGGYGRGDHMFWGGWVMMVVLILLAAGGLAVAVWALIRAGRGSSPTANLPPTNLSPANPPPTISALASDPARRILDERFARGEIDVEEYQRRRTVLEGGRA